MSEIIPLSERKIIAKIWKLDPNEFSSKEQAMALYQARLERIRLNLIYISANVLPRSKVKN